MTDSRREPLTYAGAGVDLDAREATAKRFGAIAKSTHGPQVINVPGAFASFFALGGHSLALTRLESEFGMTPSGRSRIHVSLPPAVPSALAKFIRPPMECA